MTKPGICIDTFNLATEDRVIAGEIRLVLADDGTEMLWHYEDGRHVLAHPATRCRECAGVITGSHTGKGCGGCVDALDF